MGSIYGNKLDSELTQSDIESEAGYWRREQREAEERARRASLSPKELRAEDRTNDIVGGLMSLAFAGFLFWNFSLNIPVVFFVIVALYKFTKESKECKAIFSVLLIVLPLLWVYMIYNSIQSSLNYWR